MGSTRFPGSASEIVVSTLLTRLGRPTAMAKTFCGLCSQGIDGSKESSIIPSALPRARSAASPIIMWVRVTRWGRLIVYTHGWRASLNTSP